MNVLVILGNRLQDDGTMSEKLKGRLNAGLDAWKSGKFDKIVVTGGIANPLAGKSEGSVMLSWLIESGVPADCIVVEDKSMTTKENAKFCRAIFENLGVKEITLLSSEYHIERKWLNPVRLFKRFAKVKIAQTIKSKP